MAGLGLTPHHDLPRRGLAIRPLCGHFLHNSVFVHKRKIFVILQKMWKAGSELKQLTPYSTFFIFLYVYAQECFLKNISSYLTNL